VGLGPRVGDKLAILLSPMGAVRSDPAQPVWDIRAPGLLQHMFQRERVDAFTVARDDLLKHAVAERQAIHLVTGEEEALQVRGVTADNDSSRYLLQRDVDLAALDKTVLSLGGWYLYAFRSETSGGGILQALQTADVFRIEPSGLIRVMRDLGVTFLIASFYDDNEWRLAVP
jgi:hypothetical protein